MHNSPRVFISYSWDSKEHKEWVQRLARQLGNDGVDVIFDKKSIAPGGNIHTFIESEISQSDKIIIIFTPRYKEKAEKRKDTAGLEYSLIYGWLIKNIASQGKVIPILRKGNTELSIPDFMQQFACIDFSKKGEFEEPYNQLRHAVHNRVPPPPPPPPLKKNRWKFILTVSVSFGMISAYFMLGDKLFNQSTEPLKLTDNISGTIQNDTPNSPEKVTLQQDSLTDKPEPQLTGKPEPETVLPASKPEHKNKKGIDFKKYDHVYPLIDGCRRIRLNGQYGFVDVNGNSLDGSNVVELPYDFAEDFSNGLAKVMRNTYCGFINKKGELVIDMVYDNAESFRAGQARVRKNGKWFYIDKSGNSIGVDSTSF